MTLGGAAQLAADHYLNERALDPAVCSYNRSTYAPDSRTMTFTTQSNTKTVVRDDSLVLVASITRY